MGNTGLVSRCEKFLHVSIVTAGSYVVTDVNVIKFNEFKVNMLFITKSNFGRFFAISSLKKAVGIYKNKRFHNYVANLKINN